MPSVRHLLFAFGAYGHKLLCITAPTVHRTISLGTVTDKGRCSRPLHAHRCAALDFRVIKLLVLELSDSASYDCLDCVGDTGTGIRELKIGKT